MPHNFLIKLWLVIIKEMEEIDEMIKSLKEEGLFLFLILKSVGGNLFLALNLVGVEVSFHT